MLALSESSDRANIRCGVKRTKVEIDFRQSPRSNASPAQRVVWDFDKQRRDLQIKVDLIKKD